MEGGLSCNQAGREEHKGVLGAIEYVELPESEAPATSLGRLDRTPS